MRYHTLLLPLLVCVTIENARYVTCLTSLQPKKDASKEKKASSYEYENWSGLKRHARDFNAVIGREVMSAAGSIGLAATGFGSNIATQSIRGIQRNLKSGRERLTNVLNSTRDVIGTGLDCVDRGTRAVGKHISRRLAALHDVILGMEKIMENRRSQTKRNSTVNATRNKQKEQA